MSLQCTNILIITLSEYLQGITTESLTERVSGIELTLTNTPYKSVNHI